MCHGHQIKAKITGAKQRERSLDKALNFECLIDVESLFSVCGFVFKILLSSLSHLEVIGSRSRLQEQKACPYRPIGRGWFAFN